MSAARSRGRSSGGERRPKGGSTGRNPQRRRRRNRRGQQQRAGAAFWGDESQQPPRRPEMRIAEDPAAVPRSLGPPPLPGHEAIAEHYFAAVYERAVTTAGALAAAGGLIDPQELVEDGED